MRAYTLEGTVGFDGAGAPLRARRALAEWGIIGATLEQRSLARDTLTLRFAAERFSDPDPLPLDSAVSLYRGDVRIFSGTALGTSGAAAHGQVKTCRVAGAWAQLEARQYLQPWTLGAGSRTGASDLFGRVLLGANPALYSENDPDFGRLKTGQAVLSAIDGAIVHAAPPAVQTAEMAEGVLFPWEVAQDLTCAEAVRRILHWAPSQVFWFDYATDPPSIHCQEAAALPAVTLPLTELLALPEITPAWETRVQAVIVRWHSTTPASDGSGRSLHWFREQAWPPDRADSAGEKGVLVVSLDEVDYDLAYEAGESLAQRIYEAAAALAWRGRAVLQGADVPQVAGLGSVLNLTGGDPAWAGMRAVIQSVTDDLAAGTRELVFGPPPSLRAADLAAVLAANRRRAPVIKDLRRAQSTGTSFGRKYGFDGSKDDPEDLPTTSMEVEEQGVIVRYAVPWLKREELGPTP